MPSISAVPITPSLKYINPNQAYQYNSINFPATKKHTPVLSPSKKAIHHVVTNIRKSDDTLKRDNSGTWDQHVDTQTSYSGHSLQNICQSYEHVVSLNNSYDEFKANQKNKSKTI